MRHIASLCRLRLKEMYFPRFLNWTCNQCATRFELRGFACNDKRVLRSSFALRSLSTLDQEAKRDRESADQGGNPGLNQPRPLLHQ